MMFSIINRFFLSFTLLIPIAAYAGNYDLFATAGVGTHYSEDHNTTFYRFMPDTFNFTGELGGGIQTALDNFSNVGLGVRYFYNNINGDVDPNISVETSYTNKIHNILFTLEGASDIFKFNRNANSFGGRAGAGVNAYYMDLYANDVAGFGSKVDPESKWKADFAGFLGLYVKQKINKDELMASFDYFYLGNQKSEKNSDSFPSNNLFSAAEFHNHNFVFSLTYFF